MATTCDISKDTVTGLDAFTDNKNLKVSHHVDKMFKMSDKFLNWINGFSDEVTTEENFNKNVKDNWGDKAKSMEKIAFIYSMITKHQMAYDEAVKYILAVNINPSDMSEERIAAISLEGEYGEVVDGVKDPLVLEELPLGTLNSLYQKIRRVAWEHLPKDVIDKINNKDKSLAGDGSDLNHGWLGNLKVQFLVPSKLSYHEKTGAIYNMQRDANDFALNLQGHVARYKYSTKDRPYGIQSIWRTVENMRLSLSDNATVYQKRNVVKNLNRLFVGLIRGRIEYIGGELYYYAKKDTVLDPITKEPITYDDGSYVFEYDKKSKIKLKDYTPPRGEVGDWNVEFDAKAKKNMMDKFFKAFRDDATGRMLPSLLQQFRTIDDAVANELLVVTKGKPNLTQKANAKIITALKKAFPGLDRKDLFNLFNYPESKAGKLVMEVVKANPILKANYQFYSPVFEGHFNIGKLEGIDWEAKKAKNHFPATFDDDMRRTLWESMVQEKENDLEKKEGQIKVLKEEQKTKGKLSKKKFDRLNFLLKREALLIESIKSNTEVLDMMDNVNQESERSTDTMIVPIKHNKYSKHLTNAFDEMLSRNDADAYLKYLKHAFGSVVRNEYTAGMIENTLMAESDEVKNIVVNQYKLPFNRNDIESGIGKWKYGSKALSSQLKGRGINISPDDVNWWSRFSSNWLTAVFLRRPSSAITNYSAITQNIVDYGWEKFIDGWDEWKANPDQWNDIIKKSGIIDFAEYFSSALVEAGINTKLEENLAEEIVAYQMRYFIRLDNGMSRKDALKELNQNVEDVLNESAKLGLHLQKLETGRSKRQRTKLRAAAFKSRRKLNWINELSSWAITKEVAMKETLRKGPRDKGTQKAYAAAQNFFNHSPYGKRFIGGMAVKGYSSFLQHIKLTMADSEQFVRTLSFIIGIQHVQKTKRGMLPKGNPWDSHWTEENVQAAIDIGKTYSELTNYQLSKAGMGSAGYSGLGPLMFKFKIWSHQKWAADWDKLRDAYRTVKDDFHIDSDTFDRKAIGRLFKAMFSKSPDLRAMAPEIARLKSFIATQGLMTFLFDLMILGPLPWRAVIRNVPGLNAKFGRALGSGSSDLLSFMFAPFIMMINLFFGGYDDDELEDDWLFYFRNTAFGFLPNWGLDIILGMTMEHQSAVKHRANALSPIVPMGLPGSEYIRNTIANPFGE